MPENLHDEIAREITEGRALLAVATPGPWEAATHAMPGATIEDWFVREVVHPNGDLHPLNVLKVRGARNAANGCCWPPTVADVELIVWMRNNLASVLQHLDQFQQGAKFFVNTLKMHTDTYETALRKAQRRVAELEAQLPGGVR